MPYKSNLNRSMVSIPECFNLSIADLPSWIDFFTMSNNLNTNDLQNYEIIIPDDISNEIIGGTGIDAIEYFPSCQRFTGRRIYDDFKVAGGINYGFAIYSVYEKNCPVGFRTLLISQEVKNTEAITISSKAVHGKIDKILTEIEPNEVNVIKLTHFILPDSSPIQDIEGIYKWVAKYFLNSKKTRHYFRIENNRPSSFINKKVYLNFLDMMLEVQFDLQPKNPNKPHITSIHLNNFKDPNLLTYNELLGAKATEFP